MRTISSFLEQVHNSYSPDEGIGQQTHYVVFALDRKLASKCEALNNVFKLRDYAGVSVIAVYDELRYLPKDCSAVLEANENYSKLFDRNDISGDHLGFTPDKQLKEDALQLATNLANIKLESAEVAFELPEMITFLEMFSVGKVEHLNALSRWKESNPVRSLEAPVGIGATGELVGLDLHEKVHGPHGLIAGMTGSGKSEFIMTFILSLALNYHPNELAFVLIDYKGGGMAKAFEQLPHTVGVITNLDGAAVNRSLVSIESELKRRQAIFNNAAQKTRVSNIDIYKYQSLHREGKVDEPLPHLFIISDEFAELKTQQPEFMDQLVSAARIGRSLGVHLILATQKPSGVVDDQIWANSKFKVCLKVQDKADSMDMIKRPDAAELVETGRFYLQVGYNELFEMGQSAWAGAPYFPSETVEHDYDDSVSLLNKQGQTILVIKPQKSTSGSGGKNKQLDEVTRYIINTAKEEGIINRMLWLEPLSKQIYLNKLLKKYSYRPSSKAKLEFAIGEFDDPSRQNQGLVKMSVADDGNAILYGVSGSGKTHFVSSMLYSLMTSYSPEEFNTYIIDFGSETLTAFSTAPHVGNVLIGADSEKIENMFSMLKEEVAQRRKLFLDCGGDIRNYNAESKSKAAYILVVINNYATFSEYYEDADEKISALSREGTKYGIQFFITAPSVNSIRYKLAQNFRNQICLNFNDLDDYSTVMGRVGKLIPPQIPGRGLIRTLDGVFEFQTALISEELADSPRAIREYCTGLNDKWKGKRARPVPCLPDKVSTAEVPFEEKQLESGLIPVGISKTSFNAEYYKIPDGLQGLIASKGHEWKEYLSPLIDYLVQVGPEAVGVLGNDEVANDVLRVNQENLDSVLSEKKIKLIFALDFAKKYSSLDYQKQQELITLLTSLSNAGIRIIGATEVSDLGSIVYEQWFSRFFALDSAVWIGQGFSDQYQITSNEPFYDEVSKDFGIILNTGEPAKVVKFLRTVEDQ